MTDHHNSLIIHGYNVSLSKNVISTISHLPYVTLPTYCQNILGQNDRNWHTRGTQLKSNPIWRKITTKEHSALPKPKLTKTCHQGGGLSSAPIWSNLATREPSARPRPHFTETGLWGHLAETLPNLTKTGNRTLPLFLPAVKRAGLSLLSPFFSSFSSNNEENKREMTSIDQWRHIVFFQKKKSKF